MMHSSQNRKGFVIMKRILLFLATNLAVVFILSITMRLLGVEPYLNANGLNLSSLLIFAAVMGFGGAFISLAISKWSAKTAMGVHVIEAPSNSTEFWLVETIGKYAQAAGIKKPEVGVYDSPDVNAFATGMSKDASLIAVSTGLLQQLTRQEAEAVLGHEVSHAANGDMVTMALIQGVLNTFVIVLARVIGTWLDAMLSGNQQERHGPGMFYFVAVFVLDMVFGLLASMIAMWFSRHREFRADAGGARLAGRGKMIAALQRLAQTYGHSTLPGQIQAFGISGAVGHGLRRLMMSHPPLEERIAALRAGD